MGKRRTRSINAGLAAALRYLLVRLEVPTDSQYAEDAAVSPSQVSRYTSGKVTPRASTRERLVPPLRVTVTQLEMLATVLDLVYEEIVVLDRGEITGVLSFLQVAPASGEVRLDVLDGALPLTEEERVELVRFLHFLQQKRR